MHRAAVKRVERVDNEINLKNLIIKKCRNANLLSKMVLCRVVCIIHSAIAKDRSRRLYCMRKNIGVAKIKAMVFKQLSRYGDGLSLLPKWEGDMVLELVKRNTRRRKEGRAQIERFKEDLISRNITMKHRNMLRYCFNCLGVAKWDGLCQRERAQKIFLAFLVQTSTEWNTKQRFVKYH